MYGMLIISLSVRILFEFIWGLIFSSFPGPTWDVHVPTPVAPRDVQSCDDKAPKLPRDLPVSWR